MANGVLTELQKVREKAAAEAAAVDRDYPKYVKPDPLAWAGAKSVEERNAAKVLVYNEEEHRAVAPHDFKPAKADKGDKGDK